MDDNLRTLLRGVGSLSVRVRAQGTAPSYLDATRLEREVELRLSQRLGTDAAPGALTLDISSMASEREPGLELFTIRLRFARRAQLARMLAHPVAEVSPWTASLVDTVKRAGAADAMAQAAHDLVSRFLMLHAAANANYSGPVLADDARPTIPVDRSLGGVSAVRLEVDVAPEAASVISAETLSSRVAEVLAGEGISVSSAASATLAAQVQARAHGSGWVWLVELIATDVASFAPVPTAPAQPVSGVVEIWRRARLNDDTAATRHEAAGVVSDLAREFARDYRAANPTGLRETIIVR